jgi:copper(I)-binding protein
MKHTALIALMALALPAIAQVSIGEPWVRATVPAQKATGAFMQLTADQDARLIEGKSPVAGVVQIHEMSMDGGVMKMRELAQGLALPAGKMVELKPGGYHVMLMDLKQQMKEGDSVPMSLTFETADKKRTTVEIKAAIRALNSRAAPAQAH